MKKLLVNNVGVDFFLLRNRYSSDVDQTMHLLKLVADDDRELGMINWFPVHGTSMNRTNHLVSSDNKGMASILFEQWKKDTEGNDLFVAAFAQANEGDVSPNSRGASCIDTGAPCDLLTSTCSDGKVRIQNLVSLISHVLIRVITVIQ